MKKAKSSNRHNLSLNEPHTSKPKKSNTTNYNNKHFDNNSINETSLHSISLIETVAEKNKIKSNILKELDISVKQDDLNVTCVEV